VLAGITPFLDLYATQPLLPTLARTFNASSFTVGLTVTAATIAVAIAAPVTGQLADRIGLRRVIVASAFALAAVTALAATSRNLTELIGWRFVQGLVIPGVFAVAIAYIHEEWPPARAGRAVGAYVGGTVIGGFIGRATMGITAAHYGWRTGFALLAILNLVAAVLLAWQLPAEHRARAAVHEPSAFAGHVRDPQLLATYAVGFCVLCSQVAMFSYITFPLAAPPFNLSSDRLGWLFAVYLVGAVVTPISGHWIDAYGHRVALSIAFLLGVGGALLTLSPILAVVVCGLAAFSTAIFVAQASASAHVGVHAARERGLALGLYATCYYIGGSVGGSLPSLVESWGGWPACVAFVVAVQAAMVAIAWTFWGPKTPERDLEGLTRQEPASQAPP
jgi:YNFM family putative membrane transporter